MEKEENGSLIIREATRDDNEELIHLTSLTPMKGRISIRIDRRPDFFRLLEMRGPSFVIVAVAGSHIIGSSSASAVDVLIDSKPEPVYYLGDFKVHPDYQGSTVAMRLARVILQKLESVNADLLFCTAAYGNSDVVPFFKGRAFLPPAVPVGIFNVFQIIPTRLKKRTNRYSLKEGPFVLSGISLFADFFKRFQLGPVYSEKSFENTTLITASFNNSVVAAIVLCDPCHAKQNVLIGLPFYLKGIFKAINVINSIYPVGRTPGINETVKLLYIKYYTCMAGHEEALDSLIGRARNIAFEKKYTFLAVGIHEKDPFIKVFSRCTKFTFKSMGFVASLKQKKGRIDSILRGVPFEDYSLV